MTDRKAEASAHKPKMSLVPGEVLDEVIAALTEGAAKHGGPLNWRGGGVRSTVYFDATMRHVRAWWRGEDLDAESGLHHLTKAISSLMVLRDAQLHGACIDDRPGAVSSCSCPTLPSK